MEYKALLENSTIEAIKLSFKESIFGEGLTIMCDVNITPNDDNTSYITFTPKNPDKKLSFAEIFTFGLLIGRDFIPKRYCEYNIVEKNKIQKENRNVTF